MPLRKTLFPLRDEEEVLPYGVILTLANADETTNIIWRQSHRDFTRAYGANPLFKATITPAAILIEMRIANIGDISTQCAYVWLLIHRTDNTLKTIRIKMPIVVKERSAHDFTASVLLGEAGVQLPEEILNIYAFVCDPMLDPFEESILTWLKLADDGNFTEWLAQDICRSSRKAASLLLSTQPFDRNGQTISHPGGICDFVLQSWEAGDNATFGIRWPDGTMEPLIGNMQNRPLGHVLATRILPAGELQFYLQNHRRTVYSTAPGNCRFRLTHGHLVLEWEDGGGTDFNDYIVVVIHR